MGFRTVEITGPAELHVRSGSLIVEKELNIERRIDNINDSKARKRTKKEPQVDKVVIPLEDINSIVCMGAGIRISTMAMAQICTYKISMTMLDEKYKPAGILTAYEANSKQSWIMRRQVYMEKDRAEKLWQNMIRTKIENQARALELLKLPNADSVKRYADLISDQVNVDSVEAGAAKEYFSVLCPCINRREETPMNSRLKFYHTPFPAPRKRPISCIRFLRKVQYLSVPIQKTISKMFISNYIMIISLAPTRLVVHNTII